MTGTLQARAPPRPAQRTAIGPMSVPGITVAPMPIPALPAAGLRAAATVLVVAGLAVPAPAGGVARNAETTAGAEPVAGVVLAPAAGGAPVDPAAVARAVGPLLRGGPLGPGRTPAHVVDVESGTVLFSAADRPSIPASTMKLVTAASVLEALGPDAVVATRTVLLDPAATLPRVVLVGAGDPSLSTTGARVGGSGTSLAPSSLAVLVAGTARALALHGITEVAVGFDDSMFTGPAVHATWRPSYPAGGVVAPVSALQVDQGRRTPTSSARVAEPAMAAGRAFAAALRSAGLTVRGSPLRVRERPGSQDLAQVASPTVGVLVERMLATSDNDYAEVLARLAARAAGQEASFAGVARRGAELLAGLGIDTTGVRIVDGSGLSRSNRLAPSTLTALLRAAVPGEGFLVSGLPVAGATGSLRERFELRRQVPGRGLVRAKTGTLTGVTSLAGLASRSDGRLLAFAFVDGDTAGGAVAARDAIDAAAAALVSCACAAAPG